METSEKKFFGLDINSKATPYKLVGLVVVLWISCWVLVPLVYKEPDGSGTFGDMFGVVNALFSGLAFAGLIYTILLQREELKAQRQELQLNREELRLTRDEFAKQSETFTKDQFENTFFALIELHEVIILNIASGGAHTGRMYLIDYLNYIRKTLGPIADKVECAKLFRKGYKEFHKPFLESYFRSIRGILKFIEKSVINDKEFYYLVLYNQFTDTERIVLYYQASLSGDKELRQVYRKAKYFNLLDEYSDEIQHKNLIHSFKEIEITY